MAQFKQLHIHFKIVKSSVHPWKTMTYAHHSWKGNEPILVFRHQSMTVDQSTTYNERVTNVVSLPKAKSAVHLWAQWPVPITRREPVWFHYCLYSSSWWTERNLLVVGCVTCKTLILNTNVQKSHIISISISWISGAQWPAANSVVSLPPAPVAAVNWARPVVGFKPLFPCLLSAVAFARLV